MVERETPRLIVLSGPSGVGKDTIRTKLQDQVPHACNLVTCTDRPPRATEQDGVDYYFFTKEQFQELIDKNMLAEYAVTGSSMKGTLKESLLESDDTTFWRIDMSRSARLSDMPDGTQLTEEEAAEVKAKTVVFLIGTKSLFTQKERALARDNGSMSRREYLTRLRDDWKIWQEYKDRFQTNGTHKSGVRYFVVFNENPREGQSVDEALDEVTDEILGILDL